MALEIQTFGREQTARKGVLAYVRVSTPDQADRQASLKEQRRKIKAHFEDRLGLTILDWYEDEGLSASKDHEARDDFWRMIERAKMDPRVGIIAVDDESRFFRDKYLTARVKGELREHGVVVYTTTRTADPRTMTGLWQETIEETMAQADNIVRRDATMRGMRGNIRERDPETGWAFKNGGPAPYGWKNKRLHMGNDSRGRPIGRTIWELDEPAANVRRQILMWRRDGWTYSQIRDELNRLRIPSPRQDLWSTSSIISICREDMVWTAAGYSIWNKHYSKGDKPRGEKFKPVSEWVIEPNAHPAIITETEAREIIEMTKRRRKEHSHGVRKDMQSPYLIRGNNSEGVPIFICGVCGGRVLPRHDGSRSRPRYVCSTKLYKGAHLCPTPRLDMDHIDKAVLRMLRRRFTREYILSVIEAANKLATETAAVPTLDHRERRLEEIERQLNNIQRSIMDGADPSLWTEHLNALGQERDELKRSLAEDPVETAEQKYRPINVDEANKIADEMIRTMKSPHVAERRRLLVSLVKQFTLTSDGTVYADLHPDPLKVDAPTLYAMSGNKVVAPTGRVIIAVLQDAVAPRV